MTQEDPSRIGEWTSEAPTSEKGGQREHGMDGFRVLPSQNRRFGRPLTWVPGISPSVGPEPESLPQGSGSVVANVARSPLPLPSEELSVSATLVSLVSTAPEWQIQVEPIGADAPQPSFPTSNRALGDVIYPLTDNEWSLLTFIKASQLDEPLTEKERLLERIRQAVTAENKLRGAFGQQPIPASFEAVALAYLTGWGPFEYFRGLPGLTKLMVNGRQATFIEQDGSCCRWGKGLPAPQLNDLIEALTGQRLSPSHAILHVLLPDGSWLNATDVSVGQDITVTICRHPDIPLAAEDLLELGMLPQSCLEFLSALLLARVNIVVAGEPGSGKTTLVAALANRLSQTERVVILEEAFPELRITLPNVVRMLSPVVLPEDSTYSPFKPVTLADLLSNALHQAPGHIVIDTCQSQAALAMLEAMNTGQTGWLITLNAHSTRHALFRLETLALQGMSNPTPEVIQYLIASSIQVVAYLAHSQQGIRVQQVDAVVPNQEGSSPPFSLLPLFRSEHVEHQLTLQRTSARLPEELANCLLHSGIDPTPYLEGQKKENDTLDD